MSTTISAIYEGGTLHLFEPLTLPETSKVQVIVEESGSLQSNTFRHYVVRTKNALSRLDKTWSENAVYETVVKLFQDELFMVDQLCPSDRIELSTMLILATQRIVEHRLSKDQITAIQLVIDKLLQDPITEADIDASYECLLDSGLYFTFNLEEDALLIDTDVE